MFLIACANNQQQSATKDKQNKNTGVTIVKKNTQASAAEDNVVAMEAFSGFPKSSKECNSYFAADTTALQSQNYLLVGSSAGKAYVKVNNRLVTLKLDDKIDEASFVKEIYKGSGYMVHLIMHKTRKNDNGTWLYVGEILILKNNQQESKTVVGQIGC